jgi:hypothetical protein
MKKNLKFSYGIPVFFIDSDMIKENALHLDDFDVVQK